MENKRMLRVGIDGMGGMGRLYYKTLAHIPHCTVTAVASRSFSQEQSDIRVYPDISDMLASEELDVVCVCTPTHLHASHTLAALERSVHTIVEKPLALHESEAAALYRSADESGVQLLAAHVVRFAYASKILRRLIDSAQYGGVTDACFARLSTSPVWSKDSWAFDESKSGLVPFDLHIHDLDMIVSLFGEPDSCRMIKGNSASKPTAEFNRFIYTYNGFDVFAEAAWYDAPMPFTTYARVCFERGLAVCQGDKVTVYENGMEPAVFEPILAAGQLETGTQVPKTDMYLKQLTHFLDCIRRNAPSDIVNREEVLLVLRLLERMRRA